MDVACEAAIVDFLTSHRPDDAILGEEGSGRDGTTGVRWIIDPIDGTVNFVHGHPGFGVSVAAEAGGQVVAGAVIDPMLGETFTAHREGGARLNGRHHRGAPRRRSGPGTCGHRVLLRPQPEASPSRGSGRAAAAHRRHPEGGRRRG